MRGGRGKCGQALYRREVVFGQWQSAPTDSRANNLNGLCKVASRRSQVARSQSLRDGVR